MHGLMRAGRSEGHLSRQKFLMTDQKALRHRCTKVRDDNHLYARWIPGPEDEEIWKSSHVLCDVLRTGYVK
jgi:hypothetical protein